MKSFRDQRLANDYEELVSLQQRLRQDGRTKLDVQPVGSRPYQSYNLFFHCGGFVDEFGSVRQRHQIFLEFPKVYPMEAPPTFKRVSPLFHPNIYPHGVFCLGFEGDRQWSPTVSLESLILHVSRLIRFDPEWVNLDPPANRTSEFWNAFLAKARPPADAEPFVVGSQEIELPTRAPEPTPQPATEVPTRMAIRVGPGPRRSGQGPRPVNLPNQNRPSGPIRVKRVDGQ